MARWASQTILLPLQVFLCFPVCRGLYLTNNMESVEEHNKWKNLTWRPNSQDPHPIEPLWDVLEKQIQFLETNYRNLQDFKDLPILCRGQTPQCTFRRLVKSVTWWVRAAMVANGGPRQIRHVAFMFWLTDGQRSWHLAFSFNDIIILIGCAVGSTTEPNCARKCILRRPWILKMSAPCQFARVH